MHAELPAFKGTGDGMQYGFLILTEGGVGFALGRLQLCSRTASLSAQTMQKILTGEARLGGRLALTERTPGTYLLGGGVWVGNKFWYVSVGWRAGKVCGK